MILCSNNDSTPALQPLRSTRRLLVPTIVLTIAGIYSSLTLAQDVEWTGTTSTNWTVAGNWSTGTTPGADDDVWIDTLSPHIAVLSGSTTPALGELRVSDSQPARLEILNEGVLNSERGRIGLQSGSDGEVLVSGAGSQWNMTEIIRVGVSGDGLLRIEDGGLVTNGPGTESLLGSGSPGVGEVIVTGVNSRWELESGIRLGFNGTGHLEILEGGSVEATGLSMGSISSASGSLTIHGPNSSLQTSSGLGVGSTGTGALYLSGGGTIESGTESSIGTFATGVGEAHVSGANTSWQGQLLRIGHGGTGELEITDGAQVIMDRSEIGRDEDSVGLVRVSGAGSELLNTDTGTIIGWEGSGHLEILDGAYMHSVGFTWVGVSEGSDGTVIIDGPDSLLETSTTASVGMSGTGELQLTNGGRIQSTSQINVAGAEGTVSTVIIGGAVDEPPEPPGLLDVSILTGGNGTARLRLNHSESAYYLTRDGTENGESINLTGSVQLIHDGPGTTLIKSNHSHESTFIRQGQLVMTSGSINHADSSVLVGGLDEATGTFLVEFGTVTSNLGILGAIERSVGEVTLGGPGANWNTDSLIVGGSGSGHLLVEEGAVLDSSSSVAVSTAIEPEVESTIVANGTISSPSVLIQGMGRLSGSGLIDGEVLSTQDGILAFGNSGGNLEMSGLELGEDARLELLASDSPSDSDWLFVDGDVELNGWLDVVDLGGLSTGIYTLIEYTGNRSGFGLELGELPPGINAVIVEDEISKTIVLNVLGDEIFSDRFE